MTIQIPDDLARELEEIAALQNKSAAPLERLWSLVYRDDSPASILRAVRALPHPSPEAVADLDAAIAASRLPVRDAGAFDW